MKKIEKRDIMITYCDMCGKEINPPYTSVQYENEMRMDFCSTYTPKINKTCYDKHKEELLNHN